MKDYKRLTKKLIEEIKNERGSVFQNCNECDYGTHNAEVIERLTRLAELEDKIENGKMIELPCKVGDTVYYIGSLGVRALFKLKTIYDIVEMPFSLDMLYGYKNVWFLTKAEAEQKLKELQEQDNESNM